METLDDLTLKFGNMISKEFFFSQYVKHEIKVEVDLQGFERQQETSSRLFS